MAALAFPRFARRPKPPVPSLLAALAPAFALVAGGVCPTAFAHRCWRHSR